ncbi:MAG: hypothetical protein K2N54_04680 [Helicobacter sp.]|nr:hypothetical protein [Helicobacter sp.]
MAINRQRIPRKSARKAWQSHSTAALWILQFLIRYCSQILAPQPQRCVYVIPYGSNIDVARCGWEIKNYE